jgi:hypothetical protein
MFGDHRAGAPYLDPVKVAVDLDAPTHRDRMHRVVIAVQADVVIARQPGSSISTRCFARRRQGQHRRLVGLDPVGWAAAQCAVLTVIGPRTDQSCSWVLKSVGEVKTRPGRNARSRGSWNRSTNPLASGSRLQITTLAAKVPQNAWHEPVRSVAVPAIARSRLRHPAPTSLSVSGRKHR